MIPYRLARWKTIKINSFFFQFCKHRQGLLADLVPNMKAKQGTWIPFRR